MKKRKRDFSERQKGNEEAKTLGKEQQTEEAIKLKHGDDYRSKIIHESNRFQDKVSDKESKLDYTGENKGSKRRRSKVMSNHETTKTSSETSADYLTDVKNGKIYDPLSQDLDNDGIIDRYDNDFRDSDYFESTYDVEDNLQHKAEDTKGFSKSQKAQKKNYKRKNYSDKLYTIKKDKEAKEEKADNKKIGKEAILDREKKNRLYKEQERTFRNKASKVSALSGLAKGSETVRDYLSHGSDENEGVEAGEKTADTSLKLIHGIKNYSDKKRAKKGYDLTNKDYKIRKRKSKLEFRDAKEELKKTEEYQKANNFKRFQKRKQMKDSIKRQNKSRLRDRIKEGFIGSLKSSKKVILRRAKGLMIIFIGLIILGTFFINFAGTGMTGFMNSTSTVLTTSYLSKPNVLTEINQQFSSMEQGLQDEIESVEENYPGYDEYIVNKEGDIGHNTHELLSYITSRCGEVKNISEVSRILDELFKSMYRLEYKEEIEIRYRTVTENYTDEDGNEYTESHEEPYEYKKLILTLYKREMDSVVREVFQNYPDNVKHYEALLASLGNMSDFFGSGSNDYSEIINNPNFGNPGIAFNEETVKQLFSEAERHIGKRYVFGANGPLNFDCSSFVCWSFTHSGIKNMPRTTAWRIYTDYCNPVSTGEAKAGDIIFFKNTYNSGSSISHVGIYVGNGMMIHAGDPIQYTSINSPYWREHFYGFGRLR